MVLLWDSIGTPSFRGLIVLYCTAYASVLVYLWFCLRPTRGSASRYSAWTFGKTYILLGWPILLSNGGFVLVQSADRLVVSSTLRIYDFAQYSLAASTMFVPIMMIVAVYQVLFSHVAALEQGGAPKSTRTSQNLFSLRGVCFSRTTLSSKCLSSVSCQSMCRL